MARISAQAYSLMPELSLYSYYVHGEMTLKDGTNMPFITWPNGSPCLIANLYMLSLLERKGRYRNNGLSRHGAKGGTLGMYASSISILIRLIWKHSKAGRLGGSDFYSITDDLFTSFVHSIRMERSKNNPDQRKRNENTVNSIGHTWLDFLHFVGIFHGDGNYVSNNGKIRGQRKEEVDNTSKRGGKNTYKISWNHHSLSGGERLKTRSPIPDSDIKSLREAASKGKADSIKKHPDKAKSAKFLYQRRLCLIHSLENTGARRGELALLLVEDIERASRETNPMLRIPTLKGELGAERMLPVTLNCIQYFKKYIKIYRQPIIDKTIGLRNDHGFLFISVKNGLPLSETTLTNEIGILRIIAGISTQACAHMFRHKFITKLFVLLIEQHQLTNKDQFRQKLLDKEHWKLQIQQWTGHKNIDSLDIYIDIAFAITNNLKKTYEGLYIFQAQEAFDNGMEALLEELDSGMTTTQFKQEVKILMQLRDKDMEIAQERAHKDYS